MNINIGGMTVEYLVLQCGILLFRYSYKVLTAGDCYAYPTCVHMLSL
jgi:hypothetical protein